MATFYSDPNKDHHSEWINYLQNSSYVEDVNNTLVYQSKEIQRNVNSLSKTQSEIVQESIKAVCGTLESGFELLSGGLQDISMELGELRSELNSMASMLDWKLSLVIEQQHISNMLTGNIAILLRIPDIQKERQDYIETGLKHFKNARFDSDLFVNSRKYLLKALEIVPEDFFVLHRLGLIYMYSPKLLDLAKAEAYFKRAVKYAVAEARNESEVSNNYLRADIKKSFGEQKTSVDSVKLQAAESYLFLSRCCYIQRRFDESADYAGKALSLVPQLAEAGFSKAKALAANNKESQAAEVLEEVINIDRYFSLKILSDPDLAPKKEVQALLLKLQLETTERAYKIVEQCKKQIIPDSIAKEELFKIIRLLQKNSYLSSAKVLDLLAEKKSWNLNNGIHAIRYRELLNILNSRLEASDDLLEKINSLTPWKLSLDKKISSFYMYVDWKKLITYKECNKNLPDFIKLESGYDIDCKWLLREFNVRLNKLENEKALVRREEEQKKSIRITLKIILGVAGVILAVFIYNHLSGWQIFGLIVLALVLLGWLSEEGWLG